MSIDWSKERVVVTGGTAFIGSFLVESLLAKGASVRVPLHRSLGFLADRKNEVEWMEGDLGEESFCAKLLSDATRLFHFASLRKNVSYHHQFFAEVLEGNVRLSRSLTSVVALRPVPVVFCSSASVISETAKVSDGYVAGKSMCEGLWEAAAHASDFPLFILRPAAVYGPRDTFSSEGNVIPSLILKAKEATKSLEVWGSGDQLRRFIYVEDVIGALFRLLDADARGVQFLSEPEVVSIRGLAERIRDVVRPGLPLAFDTSKPEGASLAMIPPPHPCLKDYPWVDLREGIERTLDWFEAQR